MADKDNTNDNAIVAAAKAIGTAAGKIASLAGVQGAQNAEAKPTPVSASKPGKLQKKNKSRLPRRQKKAQNKLAKAERKTTS